MGLDEGWPVLRVSGMRTARSCLPFSGNESEKRSVDMSFLRGDMYGLGKIRTFATDSFRVLFVGCEAVKRFCTTRPAKGTVSEKDILQATCRRVIGL